jgi:hypothetical protein
MRGMRTLLIACVLLTAGLGCGSNKSYQVEVQNKTSQPVTLWLTKDGLPAEEGWYSPEELGAMPKDARPKYDLAIVPPGKTGATDKLSGKFPSGTNAVLRVYGGEKELYHILEATRPGGAGIDRADHVLKPGENKLSVVEHAGRLVVESGE